MANSYNSAVYTSDISTEYSVIEAPDSFIRTNQSISFHVGLEDLYTSTFPDEINTDEEITVAASNIKSEAMRLHVLAQQGKLDRLDAFDCMNTYAVRYQRRGSLFLVRANSTDPIVYTHHYTRNGNWVCQNETRDAISSKVAREGQQCSGMPYCAYGPTENCEISIQLPYIRGNASQWAPFNRTVSYCLCEPPLSMCEVRGSLYVTISVLTILLLQCVVMLHYTLRADKMPLLTISDAINSMLQCTDYHTKDMAFASIDDFEDNVFHCIAGLRTPWRSIVQEFSKSRENANSGSCVRLWHTAWRTSTLVIIFT